MVSADDFDLELVEILFDFVSGEPSSWGKTGESGAEVGSEEDESFSSSCCSVLGLGVRGLAEGAPERGEV